MELDFTHTKFTLYTEYTGHIPLSTIVSEDSKLRSKSTIFY